MSCISDTTIYVFNEYSKVYLFQFVVLLLTAEDVAALTCRHAVCGSPKDAHNKVSQR